MSSKVFMYIFLFRNYVMRNLLAALDTLCVDGSQYWHAPSDSGSTPPLHWIQSPCSWTDIHLTAPFGVHASGPPTHLRLRRHSHYAHRPQRHRRLLCPSSLSRSRSLSPGPCPPVTHPGKLRPSLGTALRLRR